MNITELLDRLTEAVIEDYKQAHVRSNNDAIDAIGDACELCATVRDENDENGLVLRNGVGEWCERHAAELPGLFMEEPTDDDKDLAKLTLALARIDLTEAINGRESAIPHWLSTPW